MKLEKRSKSSKEDDAAALNKKYRRDRDRGTERKKENISEKRRSERVRRSDSQEEDERIRSRRRRERRVSDSEEERDKKRRVKDKERGHRERERDKGKDRKRDRERRDREGRKKHEKERSREGSIEDRDDDDDVKLDMKSSKTSRHGDENGEIKTWKEEEEEDVEDEQKQLDEEVHKRRRRVQEWQELKRHKEEAQSESKCLDAAGKAWTLEGESDDDDDNADSEMDDVDGETIPENSGDAKMVDMENENIGGDNIAADDDDDDVDPLDAFMNTMVLPEVEKLSNITSKESADRANKGFNKALGRIIQGEDSDSDSDYSEPMNHHNDPSLDEDDEEFMKRVKKTKAEKLSLVDHSKIEYEPFRKNFYIEVKDISRMTQDVVNAYTRDLELKVHGKGVPRPIKSWYQTGLTSKILDTLKKLNYEKPMPIQAQALPIIMSGRDCIGVAKTGSGKTLGFVLPMLRHIKDQFPVEAGDGPIGLVMAPTRELVQQIHSDIKKFAKALGIRCVAVYGGSGVAQQINDLKRGTEIVVCTPGRMIDILCTSSGKITNLRRVTFLVMDEADRMFDMGFEPQITRIVQNIRHDRQTVLFSATFPRQVETLARKVLNNPVEIQVGGRSVVNKDITQLVEIRPESERFRRLLELLGEWYEKGKILVFVRSQDKCDVLYNDLMTKYGYACLSLHGGKDQADRESAISDFKSTVCNLLIATSVAARGLDVKELDLVVNFDPPNHYEDYVHRVGRTGRAGRKGCAVTFLSEDDAKYAPDLVKALELSEQLVPDDVKAVADGFMAKVKQGIEQAHGTGYGGSGFRFNEEEEEVRKSAKKAQAKEYGYEEEKSDSEDENENDVVRKAGSDISQQQAMLSQIVAIAAAAEATVTANQLLPNGGGLVTVAGFPPCDGAGRVAAMAAAANLQHNLARIQADAMPEHYEAESEINDFPQNARWRVTHKETLGPISEWSGAAITVRGQYYESGSMPGPGQRKLYLFVEGPTEISV
ncbi:PREDICTED: DEAD-box ATP-dependent RNA helicase 45-like [Camelina sativa]|uniref:RNA helicase n=1 Tax=Camelina sativa TaxID=90675 RepID=A0ABM1RPF0_CAMSA|nr:PREDICTED: DEAD-box ATP-dependent RNA helicase 45-like [Camelina sativa]